MSINLSGFGDKVVEQKVSVCVSIDHPLVKLARSLDWEELAIPVVEDLKNTTAKGFWWAGRALFVRLHLAIFLLQKLFDLTDRRMTLDLEVNAAFQVFCGFGMVEKWFVPHHTKLEEFRNRLSAETQRFLSNAIAQRAVELGFGDASLADFDSTVQEANMAYPTDANLMTKLVAKGKKVIKWLKEKCHIPESHPDVDLKGVKAKAKGYFFLAKNTVKEVKNEALRVLHKKAKEETYAVLKALDQLPDSISEEAMPWNIRDDFEQLVSFGKRYLLDVAHFIRTGSLKAGKRLSFHLDEVACISKGKASKKYEFGRVFQLARIGGNFVFMGSSASIRNDDKRALDGLLSEYESTFGRDSLKSMTADRGYYSSKNREACSEVDESHLGYQWEDEALEDFERLRDRRAGVEPVIGHIKRGGQLGRSRMKSDTATLAAGYGAGVGYNLRQLMNKI